MSRPQPRKRPVYAAYVRVDPAARDPEGAKRDQIAAIRAYGKARHWRFTRTHLYVDHADTTSGRPAQFVMVNAATQERPPFRYIVVDDYSRLFGSKVALEHFKRFISGSGIQIHSVAEELEHASRDLAAKIVKLFDFYQCLDDARHDGDQKEAHHGS